MLSAGGYQDTPNGTTLRGMYMRHLKSHTLFLFAVAGLISATVTVAAPADSDRSYLPPQVREELKIPSLAGRNGDLILDGRKAATHRRKARVRARHRPDVKAPHRHHVKNDFRPEEAILFLPRLFVRLFSGN